MFVYRHQPSALKSRQLRWGLARVGRRTAARAGALGQQQGSARLFPEEWLV